MKYENLELDTDILYINLMLFFSQMNYLDNFLLELIEAKGDDPEILISICQFCVDYSVNALLNECRSILFERLPDEIEVGRHYVNVLINV